MFHTSLCSSEAIHLFIIYCFINSLLSSAASVLCRGVYLHFRYQFAPRCTPKGLDNSALQRKLDPVNNISGNQPIIILRICYSQRIEVKVKACAWRIRQNLILWASSSSFHDLSSACSETVGQRTGPWRILPAMA
jgi:hypothetical protein